MFKVGDLVNYCFDWDACLDGEEVTGSNLSFICLVTGTIPMLDSNHRPCKFYILLLPNGTYDRVSSNHLELVNRG